MAHEIGGEKFHNDQSIRCEQEGADAPANTPFKNAAIPALIRDLASQPPGPPVFYFAYGSNMNPDQIRDRCPSVALIGKARLDNYRLAFTRKSVKNWPGRGVADVVSAPGKFVWGALLGIADQDVPALDAKEGYQPGRVSNAYERVAVTVLKDGNPADGVSAQTYVVRRRLEPNPLPHPDYVARIISGAEWIKAPAEYVAELKTIAVQA